jgi:glyoxylase-like metal-dependent hydrolase (beta-lactamase superfamily II)
MLDFRTLILGPVSTNCYIIADSDSGEAAVIDPAWDGRAILLEAQKLGWKISQLWYTHAHFDHFGGAADLAKALNTPPIVALNSLDHELWENQGGAPYFGMQIDPGPKPMINLIHGQVLRLGKTEFEVRHTPGHTPGHVVYYCTNDSLLFCGDLIFHGSVGRTDLPGGDWEMLSSSIMEQVFTLPDETQLLSGHGEKSTVGEEKRKNPFVGT